MSDWYSHASPWLRTVRYGAVGGALLLLGFAAGIYVGRGAAGPKPLADLGGAPHYTLTNQLGQTVSSKRFADKVQIVTFLFPYCTTYCPLITVHLIGLEHLLRDSGMQNRVEIVAFNVAPGDTGLKEMREFLQQYGWNPQNPHWQYLTGTKAQIHRVVTGGFHVAYQRIAEKGGDDAAIVAEPGQTPQLTVANPLAERVKPDYDISHNDAIEIVDTHGRIRKIYDDADVVSNQQLWNVVATLLKRK